MVNPVGGGDYFFDDSHAPNTQVPDLEHRDLTCGIAEIDIPLFVVSSPPPLPLPFSSPLEEEEANAHTRSHVEHFLYTVATWSQPPAPWVPFLTPHAYGSPHAACHDAIVRR